MKIGIVLGHALPFPPARGGGIEKLYAILAGEFVRRGHQVTVYSRALPGLPGEETDGCGIRHIRVAGCDWTGHNSRDALHAWKWAWRLRRAIQPADVTLFNTLFAFALLRGPQYGVRILTIHRTPTWKVKLFAGFDRIYAASDAVVGQILEIAPQLRQVKRIYNCVDPGERPFAAPAAAKPGLTFLYLGRFVADKGLEHLIRGFEQARSRFPGNRLLTVGPQTSEEGGDTAFFRRMCAYVAGHKLQSSISFRRPLYDPQRLRRCVDEADVICVPTLSGETFSMAVLEAMAAGKPALVSDFGPMPEAVEHLVSGYISRAADAGSIAAGMEYFSEDLSRAALCGEQARRKLEREFSAAHIAQEYLDDFARLLAGKAA
ncbi:MAG: glycosyltransferase family 4 protein [Chlamydiota bacterium]